MKTLVSDREAAIASDMVGTFCERYDIVRDLGGSQGHTAAPAAERRISLIRTTAHKLWATAQRTGLGVTRDHCVIEATMSLNLMLSYGGVSPSQALLGQQPRELYDPESQSLSATQPSLDTTADFIEQSTRLRLHAKGLCDASNC